MKKIKKVIFPVGGLGTRFLPATKSLPKEMLPVFNKPLIQYAFEEAIDAEIEEFIFITGRNKNAINNHFDHAYELQEILSKKAKVTELNLTRDWLPQAGQIAFIRQLEPLGLGHAVWCARNFIKDEPFAVILADELLKPSMNKGFLREMVEQYNEIGEKINMLGVYEVAQDQVNKYGIIDYDFDENKKMRVSNMVEKPDINQSPSNYAIIGRYILQPKIFDFLAKGTKGAGGEIQLTDSMEFLRKEQQFYASNFTGERFDCGSPFGFLEANISFARDVDQAKVTKIAKKYAS